jgi:hypothetical protein
MNTLFLIPEIISHNIPKSNSNFIPSHTGGSGATLFRNNIFNSLTNFLERKRPGSSSNIKIQNVNNLYNKIKNNNFPLGPADNVNKILNPWLYDYKPSASQYENFKKYMDFSPLQPVIPLYGQK